MQPSNFFWFRANSCCLTELRYPRLIPPCWPSFSICSSSSWLARCQSTSNNRKSSFSFCAGFWITQQLFTRQPMLVYYLGLANKFEVGPDSSKSINLTKVYILLIKLTSSRKVMFYHARNSWNISFIRHLVSWPNTTVLVNYYLEFRMCS